MKDGRRGAYVICCTNGWFNQALLKDCGIIPYLLYKNHGFHSVMVGYNEKIPDFPYLEKYVKGLEMDFLEDNSIETRLKYIYDHAEDIDLFICYGVYGQYIPIVDFYRKVRPDGKVYMATDINMPWADGISHMYDMPEWRRFLEQCDVIGASCRKTQRYLNMQWAVSVECIRNGWYNAANVDFDDVFDKKENIILTVGRIGTKQKNNEMLLQAFAACSDEISDWRLRLVGDVDPIFKKYIDKFFKIYPHLKDRIDFVGLVEDKLKLAEEYKKAKIFAITSIYEGGTPNVIAEALFAGCYIVTSDIDGALDATDEGRCGQVIPLDDVVALSNSFRRVCNNSSLLIGGG